MKNTDSVWRQGGAVYMYGGASVTFTSCPFTSDTTPAVGVPLSGATSTVT